MSGQAPRPGFIDSDAPAPTSLEQIEAAERQENAGQDGVTQAQLAATSRGWSLAAWAGFFLVLVFAVGVFVDAGLVIGSLASLHPWAGWAMAILLAASMLLLTLAIGRELVLGARLRRVLEQAARAHQDLDGGGEQAKAQRAKLTLRHLQRLAQNPKHPNAFELTQTLKRIQEPLTTSDDPDLSLSIIEREAIGLLDAQAQRDIRAAFAQSAWMTIVSPFAILDAGLVLLRCLRLTRRLAMVYGGVPGSIASAALIRRTFQAMIVAGTMEASDAVVQNLLGGGILGKVSTKLGEGAVSGFLTARVGLSAQKLLRPLPYRELPAPNLADTTPSLIENLGKGAANASNQSNK